MNARWQRYYSKLQTAARQLGKPVSRIKLGYPENLCECPGCERRRRTNTNFRRRAKGKPPLPPISSPPAKGCNCKRCIKRREEMRQARANGYNWRARRRNA